MLPINHQLISLIFRFVPTFHIADHLAVAKDNDPKLAGHHNYVSMRWKGW